MRIRAIPKKNGTYRRVYIPDPEEKAALRELLPELKRLERLAARNAGVEEVAHGFVDGRSPVTAAWRHVGMVAVTLTFDIHNWFDSVREVHVANGLELAGMQFQPALELASRLCYAGAPRQGLPTSPVAANLAAVVMDQNIVNSLRFSFGDEATYTRYADDLAISLNLANRAAIPSAIEAVRQALTRLGWQLAEDKSKIQWGGGRRVICGVSVGNSDVQPTRKMRRRLRAALHNCKGLPSLKERRQCRGLVEWCLMRLPRAARPSRQIVGMGGGGANGGASGGAICGHCACCRGQVDCDGCRCCRRQSPTLPRYEVRSGGPTWLWEVWDRTAQRYVIGFNCRQSAEAWVWAHNSLMSGPVVEEPSSTGTGGIAHPSRRVFLGDFKDFDKQPKT